MSKEMPTKDIMGVFAKIKIAVSESFSSYHRSCKGASTKRDGEGILDPEFAF